MSDIFFEFTGRIDRRGRQDKQPYNRPILRENLLSRDSKLVTVKGTEKAVTNALDDQVRWMGRYSTTEIGQVSPKTFAYTKDGQLWVVDEVAKTATSIKVELNLNAYPKHQLFKIGLQTFMYLVDGENLFEYDGNNDNRFDKITVTDTAGDTVNPIDIIEHRDRLFMISKNRVFISKNLDPTNFSDASDSIEIIVGSGRGQNLGLGKIEDVLFIFNTEGIYMVAGDVISAVASTFEVRLVDHTRIVNGNTLALSEETNQLFFLADDFNVYVWDGSTSTMVSYDEKLDELINPKRAFLEKATATFHDHYYMLSFTETSETENKLEFWWDVLENKAEIIRGRNATCYMKTDKTIEEHFQLIGKSTSNHILYTERTTNFDGSGIRVRLETKDIEINEGQVVRFTAFYPKLISTGNYDITIEYLVSGRLSGATGKTFSWEQNIRGETKGLGAVRIKNQGQFTDRVIPTLASSKGVSIRFRIDDTQISRKLEFVGIGMDVVTKHKKKGQEVAK